ncbi:hypothetical protein MSG28_002655 [Choristoneura fumiferana]|uniref:Uncharacterized protein n=1 Tax=Choristoneura fumiferana TaxID=7141 RepID=A0ACC0JIM0_CHOFU|nr:hypothetical protein MSG28_002655 [Choristoneura fumiferana]
MNVCICTGHLSGDLDIQHRKPGKKTGPKEGLGLRNESTPSVQIVRSLLPVVELKNMFGPGASPAAAAACSLRSLGSRAVGSQFYLTLLLASLVVVPKSKSFLKYIISHHQKFSKSLRVDNAGFPITLPADCLGRELCLTKPIDYPSDAVDRVARQIQSRPKRHYEQATENFDERNSCTSSLKYNKYYGCQKKNYQRVGLTSVEKNLKQSNNLNEN